MNTDFTETMKCPFYLEDIALFCSCFGLTVDDLIGILFG
jgi:hypothetical protein